MVSGTIFLIAVVCVAYFCGVRIVYDSKLESSWDSVEAVGTWFSAIITLALTIMIIIQTYENHKDIKNVQSNIAAKEGERADIERRIELFEHRYKIYNIINSIFEQSYTHKYEKTEYFNYENLLKKYR